PGHVGKARTSNLGGERGGRPARTGPLLQVAPQIGLDVDDHLSTVRLRLLHQEDEVVVVGVHGGGVVQVVVVASALVRSGGWVGLEQLVVGADRDVAVGAA